MMRIMRTQISKSIRKMTHTSVSRLLIQNSSYLSRSLCTIPTPAASAATSSSSSTPSPDSKDEDKKSSDNSIIRKVAEEDDDYYDDYAGSGENRGGYKKVFSYFVFGAISSLVLYSGYSIFMELFGRSAPNNLFNETFDLVRVSDEVMRMTGDPMRAYGMDTGRHSEGRRNFVASRRYKGADGSNRTRIRYTVSGPRGKANIYAEVSDKMESHEFVYLIAKDMKSGRVYTVIENRTRKEIENPTPSQTPSAAPSNPLEALLKGYNGGNSSQ